MELPMGLVPKTFEVLNLNKEEIEDQLKKFFNP